MRMIMAAIVMVVACGDNVEPPVEPKPLGQIAIEDCGVPPYTTGAHVALAPTHTVIGGTPVVIFRETAWEVHVAHLERVTAWESCVAHHE